MTTGVLQDVRTELQTLCRVQTPYLSYIRSPNADISTPNSEGAAWSHYGYDRRSAIYTDDSLRKHVFASIWERSLDPRRLGEDDDNPDISTIAWRKWPPANPILPGGVKIPLEKVYSENFYFPPEVLPLDANTKDFYYNLKGLLNTNQTQSISCDPPALLFLNSDKGMFYSVKVKLKNIGNVPRRVKIVPPSNTCFQAFWNSENTTVAPGLTATLCVNFKPKSNESINEILFITVEGDGGLTIPLVSASVPPPILQIEEWNCGCCVTHSRRQEKFEIRNVGRKGRFWLLTEAEFKLEYIAFQRDFQKSLAMIKARVDHELEEEANRQHGIRTSRSKKKSKKHARSPFRFNPICFQLERNQKITIKVKYFPKTAGLHYEKIAMMCDNGEVRWIALKGVGIDIKSRRLVELQAFPYWSGPPADLPADSVNCQYSLDLGDLTGGETGSRNYKMLNKSCIPLYYFWSVRPLSVDDRSLRTHQAFQHFYEESSQAAEWADYTDTWDDGDPVVEDRVDVKIHPSQGVLKPKETVDFNLSAICPQQSGYFCCVVSLFAEQVDDDSMTVINPFLKSLEELQINDVPIHLDDLLETMPQDKNAQEVSDEHKNKKKKRSKAHSEGSKGKLSLKGPGHNVNEWEGEQSGAIIVPPSPPPGPDPLLMEFLHPGNVEKPSPSTDDLHKHNDADIADDSHALRESLALKNSESFYIVTQGDSGHEKIERIEIPHLGHHHHSTQHYLSYIGNHSVANEQRLSSRMGSKAARAEIRKTLRGSDYVTESQGSRGDNRLYSAAETVPEDHQQYMHSRSGQSGYATDVSFTGGGDYIGGMNMMEDYGEYSGEYYEMEGEVDDLDVEEEELLPHMGFRIQPNTYTWLHEHSALKPIAEIEVWLRSVPLQIEFHPPFIISAGLVKTRALKNLVVHNKSLFDVEVTLNQLVDPVATILIEPHVFNLKPNHRMTFKLSVLHERHGKCFEPITGTMRIGKLKTEAPCTVACSIETTGPFIKTDTPAINFGVIKVSTEKMQTISITNLHNRTAKWVAHINEEPLISESNVNLTPFNATVCEQKLLRVWPAWGVLEPQETMGLNVYLSGELTGQIAASVTVMVEGIPESALYIPICAEVQSPFLILEDSIVLIPRDSLYIAKHIDFPVTLTNPTSYPVPFAWQECLVGRQGDLLEIQFHPSSGILPPKATKDCTFSVFFKTEFEHHIRNAFALCHVDGMKEPLVLRVSTY